MVEKAKAEPFPAEHVSRMVGKWQSTSSMYFSLSSLSAYVIRYPMFLPLYLEFGIFLKLEIMVGSDDPFSGVKTNTMKSFQTVLCIIHPPNLYVLFKSTPGSPINDAFDIHLIDICPL